jgi:hypothetical protein
MTNCVIRNHTLNGIFFGPTANSQISVSNTLVADNGGNGIRVLPSGSGPVKVSLNRVEIYNNSLNGISVEGTNSTGTINATVADSVAAGNGSIGFLARSGSGQATTNLMVVRSVAAYNNVGISANNFSTATLRVGQSTITGNTTSWTALGGAIVRSYGDNNIDGNGDAPEPAPTTIVKK